MTKPIPSAAEQSFDSHEALDRADDGYEIASTVFDSVVTASEADADWALKYTVTVQVPTLRSAVAGEVGDAVLDGWLDTFERRLEDAPKATRATIELDSFEVTTEVGTVTVEYGFTTGDPDRAADIAKTFVEYVEGTYVEGIVPGYDYQPPVSKLLNQAQSGGADGERGGTPL